MTREPDAIERELNRVFAEALPESPVQDAQDFFTCGNTEDRVETLLNLVQLRFRIAGLDRERFLEAPTVSHLGRMVAERLEESDVPQCIPLQEGSSSTPILFYVGPGEDDGAGFRRVVSLLGTDVGAFLLRPSIDVLHGTAPYALEDAATQVATMIRAELTPGRPAILLGYCRGGVVAYQAAALLGTAQCHGLILLEAPMPGHPYPFGHPAYLRRLFLYFRDRQRHVQRTGDGDSTFRAMARKLLWHTLSMLRPALRTRWKSPVMQRLIRASLYREVPYHCRIRPLPVPLLHVLGRDEEEFFMREARMGWTNFCYAGGTETVLPGTHQSIFFRANVPAVAEAIGSWLRQRTV